MLAHSELTDLIINAFYSVYNTLGYGFAERVYHGALVVELRNRGLSIESEKPLPVHYKGHLVGDFYVDIVVNDRVILELKAAKAIGEEHRAQILNYLRASPYEVGLILNFGPKPGFERKVFENQHKGRPAHMEGPKSPDAAQG